MRKKIFASSTVLVLSTVLALTACGKQQDSTNKVPAYTEPAGSEIKTTDKQPKEADNEKTLIAYFTLADNYEDSSKMDTTSQASLNLENGELIGNTEYLAMFIQQAAGGDMFSIQVEDPYPNDYDRITDMGSEEQDDDARPALSSHVENMEQYQTIYLGFPIWWYTMPQAVFTFLEEYDFSGKTIIPFATDGGYGTGSSVKDIKKLCPDANVVTDIFEAERDGDIPSQQDKIDSWIKGLN